ncbi:hypothetical protein LPJ63_000791 [Coemansia sp. RSA 2711]|nr:hypothetical protein LPJ63_000791 [Coemansia sp. RSA 2711]KAJ2365745.1 hypothetical protein H4S01_003075 [Coemansia sp. RSA 2610]KAJ2388246.1 hypothetical protein H4S02_002968 [Coemansia sp. RSA 2611]
MVYTVLFPKWWFRVQLTHAPEDKQPKRGGRTLIGHIRDRCPMLANPAQALYVPPWLMPQGDMQTIYLYTQHYKPAGCVVEYEREIFEFADGGKAAVDWALPRQETGPTAPLIILVPGIAGTSYDYYARSFICCLRAQLPRCQVAVLQSRGCNGVKLATPKAFHGGMTDDLREFVAHIASQLSDTPLIGIGFSLGANILTKYVGEEGSSCQFIAAASVCNPFDIDTTVSNMSLPTLKNRYLYAAALTRSLISVFTSNRKVIMAGEVELDADAIEAARTITEFNEAYTAKVFGYSSAQELNAEGSCVQHIKHIQIPMLFINALDDPMCYRQTIPAAEIECNPNLVLAITRHGGHLAYFEGSGLAPWLPPRLTQFVAAMLEWR